MYPTRLTLENLRLRKEKTYFTWLAVLSAVAWLAIVVTVVGLIYGLLIGLILWIANGLLIAHLKAGAVRVGEKQLPELYASHVEVCGKLGLAHPPALYVQQAGGVLNAFATRHGGRDFVVIYSSLLEAYGHGSPQIKFLIGHEIGHIKSKHLLKHLLLLPGLLVPLIAPAYNRACEASCDRHGAFASGDAEGSVRAMLTLSGGREAAAQIDAEEFAEQHFAERGFFISWHELSSTYPTQSQRVANLLAIKNDHFRKPPGRHPLAYPFAIFSFSLRTLILIYVVVILGALAFPAMRGAIKKAHQMKALSQERQHRIDQGLPPANLHLSPQGEVVAEPVAPEVPITLEAVPAPTPAPVPAAPPAAADPAPAAN